MAGHGRELVKKYRTAEVVFSNEPGGQKRVSLSKNGGLTGTDTATEVLSMDEVRLLMYCNSFLALEEHAAAFTREFALKKEDGGAVLARLEHFARDGFLIEETSYLSEIFARAQALEQTLKKDDRPEVGIEIIGIPTTNRADELDRALESFIKNVSAHGRTPEFVISDDSSGDDLEKDRAIIDKHRKNYRGTITHLDRDARRELAQKIAAQKIPLDIATFAVCGDESSLIRTGALRNAILLYARGKKILFIDDDVICTPRTIPQTDGRTPFSTKVSSLYFSSALPKKTWLFESYDEATDHFQKHDGSSGTTSAADTIDYLAAHETLLGRGLADIIAKLPSLDALSTNHEAGGFGNPSLLRKLSSEMLGRTKITSTYTGAVGHSWMRVHSPAMIHSVASIDARHQLWGGSAKQYEHNRNTPFIAQTPEEYSIYSGPNCISLNLGVDARTLVPPFSPLYRGQDAVFGYLLEAGFGTSIAGYIPLLIEHRRNELRSAKKDGVQTLTTIGRMTAHLLNSAYRPSPSVSVSAQNDPSSQIGAEFLRKMGRAILDRTSDAFQADNLKKATLLECAKAATSFADHCRSAEAHHSEGPEYWKKDIAASIASARQSAQSIAAGISTSTTPIFWDVDGMTWPTFIEWARKYATLLTYWPDMFLG